MLSHPRVQSQLLKEVTKEATKEATKGRTQVRTKEWAAIAKIATTSKRDLC
jgi:hypothetical protein